MRSLLFNLFLALLGVGIFFAVAWFFGTYLRAHPEVLPPALGFLSPEGVLMRPVLSALGIVLIGGPVGILFYTISALGPDKTGQDPINGVTTLRLKLGARILLTLTSAGLVYVFVRAFQETGSPVAQVLVVLGGVVFGYMGLWILFARVRFDAAGMTNTDWLLRQKFFPWSELTGVRFLPEKYEFAFHFTENRKTSVSQFYAGLPQLMIRARTVLEAGDA